MIVRMIEKIDLSQTVDLVVHVVDLFPHFAADLLTRLTGILAGKPNAGENRVRVCSIEAQAVQHAGEIERSSVSSRKQAITTVYLENRLPIG